MLVDLVTDLERGIPGPGVLDELLVLGVSRIKLLEVVGLVIGSDVKGGDGLLSADEESTLNDGVVVDTVDAEL